MPPKAFSKQVFTKEASPDAESPDGASPKDASSKGQKGKEKQVDETPRSTPTFPGIEQPIAYRQFDVRSCMEGAMAFKTGLPIAVKVYHQYLEYEHLRYMFLRKSPKLWTLSPHYWKPAQRAELLASFEKKGPLKMAFITAEGKPKTLEERYPKENTMFQWVQEIHFSSYQACTSKQRLLSANRGECPVELRLEAPDTRPDYFKNSHDELKQTRNCIYSDYKKAFAASVKESPALKTVLTLIRDKLPQSRPVKNVAAFVPTCINNDRARDVIFAAEIAMLFRIVGEENGTLGPFYLLPITYDDDHACRSLPDYLKPLYPWLNIKIGGASFNQLFDLGIPRNGVPSVEQLSQMVTLLNVNKDSFIMCLDSSSRPLRQAAMEIIGPLGPAGMLCQKIDGDDVPSKQPHDWIPEVTKNLEFASLQQICESNFDPNGPNPLRWKGLGEEEIELAGLQQMGVGNTDPSSPSLLRWKARCHEIPLGTHHGKDLVLYLRRSDISEDTVMAET
jgi:hypothetical protein